MKSQKKFVESNFGIILQFYLIKMREIGGEAVIPNTFLD